MFKLNKPPISKLHILKKERDKVGRDEVSFYKYKLRRIYYLMCHNIQL